MDIGSHDMSKMRGRDPFWRGKIRSLVGDCLNIANQFGPGVIVLFMEVVPRSINGGVGMTIDVFERYAEFFNKLLFLEQGKALRQGTGLRFAKIQGLRNMYSSSGKHHNRNRGDFWKMMGFTLHLESIDCILLSQSGNVFCGKEMLNQGMIPHFF